MENKIELRKAEEPSKYLPRIPMVEMERDFYSEVEENSEEIFEILADGELIGLAYIEDDEEAFVYVYIFEEHRGKGYSYPAALAAERSIKASPLKSIQTGYDANNALAKKLAEKCGYAPTFASAIMKYRGEKLAEKPLPIRAYRDEDFLEAYTLTDEAFHNMRLGTGLFPDSKLAPPTDKEHTFWSETASERFVYEQDGEIVGCGRICEDTLSFIAIKIARQGEGFGRDFVIYLTNRLLEKGEARLWCVVGNDKARKLYESIGFRETDRAENAKKYL
jgi:RimJ/RimL family protein N-acetyltransferase